MAGDFDGSDFVGVDDHAFGEPDEASQVDSNTRPLSTFLENRIDGNSRYLHRRGSQFTYQFFSGEDEGIRKFTSDDWSSLLTVPWPLRSDLDSVTCYLLCDIDNDDGTTTGQMAFRLSIQEIGGAQRRHDKELRFTDTGSRQVIELTLDLSDKQIDPGFGYLRLDIKSNATSNTASTTGAISTSSTRQLLDVDAIAPIDATNTLISQPADGDGQIPMCHYFGSGSTNLASHFGRTDISSIDLSDVGVYEMSYIRPQSATFSFEYDTDAQNSTWISKNAFSMQAQRPVLGQGTAMHGTNLDDTRSRWRCLSAGPPGNSDGELWPTGYRRKWSWGFRDAGTSESFLVDSQSLKVTEDATRIWCVALMGYFVMGEPVAGDVFQWEDPYRSDDERGVYVDAAGTMEVDYQLQIDQLDDGDTAWGAASGLGDNTVTADNQIAYPTTPMLDLNLPTQVHFSRVPTGGGAEATDHSYTFREGQLYENDLFLLNLALVSVDLQSSTHRSDPMRARLTVDPGEPSGIPDSVSEFYGDDDQGLDLTVICTQTAYFEEYLL